LASRKDKKLADLVAKKELCPPAGQDEVSEFSTDGHITVNLTELLLLVNPSVSIFDSVECELHVVWFGIPCPATA
jgi:hypothetical protein